MRYLEYYSNLENTALLRNTSDDICEEYGLTVLREKECKSGINFENFYKKSLANSDYYIFAKEDLDYAISHSYSMRDFEMTLSAMGYSYYYRYGKLSIRREPYRRAEIKKMEEYSEHCRFLCRYRVATLVELQRVKQEREEKLRKALNERDRLYYRKQKLDNEEEKVKTIRKEIRFCNEIEKRVPVMKREIKELDERDKRQKEACKDKRKERMGEVGLNRLKNLFS